MGANPDPGPIQYPPAPVVPQPATAVAAPAVVSPGNGSLSFTNSAYGGVLPIVYGADRLAGNVIWASAPQTINTTVNGAALTYQTISFAIALCEGAINGVLRIWVGVNLVVDNTISVDGSNIALPAGDGKIGSYTIDLTDPTGPLAVLPSAAKQTKLTVYVGSDTQLPCPAMTATDGYALTPAYRGVAYVVFENFLLGSASVPAVFFEITSHTVSSAPRLFGDFQGTTFDTWRHETLAFDPSYNRFYINATKTSPSHNGLVVVDGNVIQDLAQYEINTLYGIGPNWETLCVLPNSGLLIASEPSVNRGILRVFNPLSGGLLYSLGPGGDLSGNYTTGGFTGIALTGPGLVQAISCPTSPGAATYQDLFVGVGALNLSVAVASVDSNGIITMLAAEALNGVLPAVNNTIGVVNIHPAGLGTFTVPSAVAKKFYDGVPSTGTHVFGFSFATNETTSIKVWRLTLSSALVLSPSAAAYTQLADIGLNAVGGAGFTTAVRGVISDASDGCLVLIVEVATRGTFIAKYSPFTGTVLWSTNVPAFPTSVAATQMPQWALLNGNKYCWITSANAVQQIDLKSGVSTQNLVSLGSQSMPNISDALQFYNCYENSIVYMSATANKHLVKLFIDRLVRTSVELSDIATDLIERTGLLPADILINDLTALTVHGYTIYNQQSIRQCFSDLAQAFIYDVVESNGKILFKTRGNGVDVSITHDLVMGAQGGSAANSDEWLKTTQINDGARLRKINLTYRDIDRDYANNVQSVILSKYGNQVFDPEAFIDVTVPIAMNAAQAVALAEILLYAKLTYNTTFEFTLAPSTILFDPADVIAITMPAGEDNLTVRLRQVTVNTDNSVMCQASEENSDIYTDQVNLFGQLGRFQIERIPVAPGRVDPFMLLIPGRDAAEIAATVGMHRYYMAFLSAVPGTVLTKNITVTIAGQVFSVVPPPHGASWGVVVTPPNATFASGSTDFASQVVVDMIDTTGLQLASAPGGKADLLANDLVNLCYIAGELFQFVTAVNVSGKRWALTELHRAKTGTETAVGKARAGDRFVLLGDSVALVETDAILAFNVAVGTSPTKSVSVDMATGNPFQAPFSGNVLSINLRPFVVSDFLWSYVSTDAVITWQRSSRTADSSYPDDGSVPPSESVSNPELSETYVLFFYTNPATFNSLSPATYMRKATVVNAQTFTYTAAMQTADAFDRTTQTLYCSIQQTGSTTGIDDGAMESHSLLHV